MSREHLWAAALCVLLAAPGAAPTLSAEGTQAAAPKAFSLGAVRTLTCAFTLMTTGTWNKDEPAADVTPAKLSITFSDIDTEIGSANVSRISSDSAGAPHITVRLLGENLHFMAMNVSGSVYLTTAFADQESRKTGRLKAVHTRHEFTPVRLTGWTSRPEQYYGYCTAG